ncbi:MAG: ion transporter [Spirochaetales bacterium]|nr:ion transporter [Spirochaetales bacterium]
MNRRFVAFLEGLVIAAILLVLVQTFLEDFATLAGWSVELRGQIALAGFFFDLFFTIEFLVRLYYAILDRRLGRYLGPERGWIDLLASVPLLMFHSGPYAAATLAGAGAAAGLAGTLSLVKVLKAVRIARVLRFLRIIKLFRRTRKVSSPMAQRHVATVTAISVSVVVLSLLFFTLVSQRLPIGPVGTLEQTAAQRQERIAAHLASLEQDPVSLVQALGTLEETEASLLVVRFRGQTLFTRWSNPTYASGFAPGDYSYLARGDLELFFDQRPYAAQLARHSLVFFAIVVLLVLAYVLAYSPHFARTVSDPIRVMRRGLSEPDYNLEVRIPERYREDDVFQLAGLYNERYLPLKERSRADGAAPKLAGEIRELFDPEEG